MLENIWKRFIGYRSDRFRDFPGHQPGEEVKLIAVCHWMVLAPFLGYFSLGLAGMLYLNFGSSFLSTLNPMTELIVNVTGYGILTHLLFLKLYNYLLRFVMVTDIRLIDNRHSIYFKREKEIIPLSNIQDIRYIQKGLLPRIFKYGDLIVLGSSSDVRYEFHFVPQVAKVHHLLGDVHQNIMEDSRFRSPSRFVDSEIIETPELSAPQQVNS